MERVVFVYVTYYPKKYVNNTNEQHIKLMKLFKNLSFKLTIIASNGNYYPLDTPTTLV